MPDLEYKSPRTGRVWVFTPDDSTKEPTDRDYDWISKQVEQIETDSEQSALGAFGSAVGQGLATMPGTVLQGVGAMVGSTGLEEAGKYSAGQAREAFPIDPMRREDFTTKAGQAVGQAIGQLGLAVGTGGGSIGTGLVLGTAAAMGAASGSERAEQSGLTGARRMGRVYGSALTELASERLFGLGSKTFFKPAAIPTTFGQKGLRFAGTSAGEGVEEIAAGVGNNIVDNVTAAGLDIPTPDIVGMNAFKSYAEQGLLGMVGGTVFAGAQLALGSQAAATPVTRAWAPVDGVMMEVTGFTPAQRKALNIEESTIEYRSTLPAEDADLASKIPKKEVQGMVTEMMANPDADILDDALNLNTAASVLTKAMAAGTPAAAVTPAPTQVPIVSTPEEAMTSTGAPTPVGAPAAAAAEITEFPAEGPTNLVDLSNLSFTGTPTQTPTFNATLQGDFTENRVKERVQTNEGGTPTEAGRGDSTVERGQVEQAVAEDETVAPPPAVEPGGEGLLNVIARREEGEKGAAATAAQSLTQGLGGKSKKRPPAAAVKAAQAFKAAAAAAAAPAAPTEIPVPQAPASPQAIVNSIPEITATITGETTGTGSTVPAETISLQSEGGPTGSLPAAVSPMTRVSGGLGSVVPSASERAARIAKYKVGSRQSAYDLATIAKAEGVDLSTMSREEYVAYAKKQGIRLSDQTLREQAILRMASSVTEATQMRKSMAPQTLEEEQADKKFASFADWVKKAAEGKGVTNNGEVAPGVAVRSGTKDSSSWLFFGIGKGAGTDASGLTHKSYIGFTNHYKSLTPRRFIDFMSALKDAGYNGDVKSMQDLMSQSSLQDQIVMHGNTEADAQLALQVAKSFFGPELSFTDIGVDNTNIGSHSEILAKTLSDELAAESSAPAAAAATPAATAAAPTGAPAAATPAAAAAAAAPAAPAPAAEEALPEEPEPVDPNSYKTGDSKDIFVEPDKKLFSQFFGEDNPYSLKEKQSDEMLRNEFVRKYLVDGRSKTTQQKTDEMYELMDTLRSRKRLEAQRQQNIAIDPKYGNYDAVPAVQLAEIYLYASRLNDGGEMLRYLKSVGSLFYYSYEGTGRSAARGLNAISHFVRKINIAKARDIHAKGQSENAGKKMGVGKTDLLDLQNFADGATIKAEDLSQGLSEVTANGKSLDNGLPNLITSAVTPAGEPLVTEADLDPQVAAEAASAAEAANVERAQTESRGLDPDTNTEIGDTIYTANPEPKSPNAPKVTPAQARIIVTQTLGFTPKNVAFEDTDVPNEDGDQYAGKVNKSTKQITINLRNINDSTHLKDVLFEEMDHLVYADPMVQAEIALLAENLPEDIRQEVRQYRPEFQREEATIRFMRRLEQEPNTASLWKKFVDAVRAAIRRLFNGQLTTRDLKMAADRVAARSFQAMAAQSGLSSTGGISYSLAPKDPNQPAPEAPDLGPNIFTEEASALAATSIALQAKIKARPAPNVAKAKADPNIEFTKSFIAAWDRASGKEKADAKPKEKIPAKEVISEFTSLPKKGKGYALTNIGRDAFLTALNQKLVDLGVPSDLAFEATRRAWATYSTKKQKNIDAKALAAAKKDIREQQRLAKKTADEAQAALDKPTNTAKDYLKPAAAPKGPAVQDPVRKALRDAEKIPRIGAAFNSSPEARNAFMTGLSSKLISLGVDQQTAWAAANKAWSTYQTNLADKVTALRKDIENNKMSAILARELKKIPVYQQNDIQYVREYMKNILVFGGLAEDVADAAATLYINKYVDLMKQTKVKAAEKFIESESGAKIKKKIATKPTEYDKLMEAVRLGVTDQSFTAALAFTAPSKFQAFTQADHNRMVALEEEIQDPDTPNLIKVQKVNELMKLADSRMNDINALNVFTGYLVNNTLSGIGTAAIQVFTPFYSMGTRWATDGVRGLMTKDPQRFIASTYAIMDAADTVTAEFKYSFGNDVFRRGQQAELRTLTDLRKVLDNNLKIYQTTTNGLEKMVAASKIALAAPDYVRRLYSAMDTASQSLFINQIKVVGIYDAMKKNGMSLKKFKDMLDAKRTFRDAYTITLRNQGGYTENQIRLIAEDAAMNDFGEQVATTIGQGGAETIADVYKMAELEGPSEIGVAESVDGHVIPFLLDVLDSIKSSGDRAAGQGAGDLAFRLVVGYPTTALKVLNRSLYFFPPTAVVRMILNKRYENQADFDPEAPRKYEMLRTESQKHQRMAELVTGSLATIILMALIMDERDKEEKDRRFAVHNLGPSDRAAKQAWRAAGNVAQSIQWRASETSPWISVSWAKAGLESLAPVLALVGTVYDSRDEIVDEGKMADHALNVAGGVMGVFNRPLSGLNDIGEILSGEKNSISQKSLASYTAFRASGLVPFSSLLKTYNRTQGPRDLSTATSTMMAQIPIAGPSLTEPGLNLFGDPLGATPNELTYKLPILPVQVGLRQQDVPFYEKILSKGQYPPLKLRTTFEKTYGPVTDSVWRQYVEKRGQMVKKLIIDRWTDLDTLSPEIYDKVLGKFAEAADETVIQELKIQRVPKPVIK